MFIILPEVLESETISTLIEDLEATEDIDMVTLNFGRVKYATPTGMLVAGSKIRRWRAYRHSCGYQCFIRGINPSVPAHSYLMHMGFFDFINVGWGKRIGEAPGSGRYLPITRIERPNIDVRTDGLKLWYDAVISDARRLSVVLAGSGDDSEEFRTYSYCIREIIRNVFEHAQVGECYVAGQRWQNGIVEIAIIDEGVGLSATLLPQDEFHSNNKALMLAVQPGVSRTDRDREADNIFGNSGFGLYVLTQLAGSFGSFVLGSDSAQMLGVGRQTSFERTSFDGTYFGMRLISSPRSFTSVLDDIIQAGEEDAAVLGVRKTASGMSRLGTDIHY